MKHIKHFMLTMLVALVSLSVKAYDFKVDGIYYNILSKTDKTCEVTYKDNKYNSYSGDITVPSEVIFNGDSYSVIALGEMAFYKCTDLISVKISNGVKTIEHDQFEGSPKLTSVSFPPSITFIDRYAFYNCYSLESIYIEDMNSWLNIQYSEYCGLSASSYSLYLNGTLVTEVDFPTNLTKINRFVFSGCSSLLAINIPKNVSVIEEHAFSECTNLQTVNCNEGLQRIEEEAFWKCKNIYSLKIPNGVSFIGPSTFSLCEKLTELYLPNTIDSIDSGAFHECTKLKFVNVPDSYGWCRINFGSYDANPLYYSKALYINSHPLNIKQSTE